MSAEEESWEWEAAVESPASTTDGTAVDRRMKHEVVVSFILNFLIKMIMFIFGLVVLVVNDFVDFNFMSSNHRKNGLAKVGKKLLREVRAGKKPLSTIVSYKKGLGRR